MITQVCSSANSAVHSVDAVAEAQRRELEIINGFLHFKRVPVDLRRRTSPGFIRVECALHWGVWCAAEANRSPRVQITGVGLTLVP